MQEAFTRWNSVTGGNKGLHVKPPQLFGWELESSEGFYYLCLVLTVLCTLGILNLPCAPPPGAPSWPSATPKSRRRAWASTWRATRPSSFALSAAITGIAGALYGHKLQFISPDQFGLLQSIELLLLIVVGGLGSVHGAFLGAIFLISMPQLIALSKDSPARRPSAWRPACRAWCSALVLIAFVLFEPMGIYGRWLKIRTYLQIFPFYRKGMFKRQKSFQKSDRLS